MFGVKVSLFNSRRRVKSKHNNRLVRFRVRTLLYSYRIRVHADKPIIRPTVQRNDNNYHLTCDMIALYVTPRGPSPIKTLQQQTRNKPICADSVLSVSVSLSLSLSIDA